jgi:hypothetical protein
VAWTVAGVLWLLSWFEPGRVPRRLAAIATAGAVGGVLIYALYNQAAFDSPVPISGRIKAQLASVKRGSKPRAVRRVSW